MSSNLLQVLLTRRSILFGTAACALGLSTTSCGLGRGDSGFPSTDEVTDALRDLAHQVGRETFQSVEIYPDGLLIARLLMADGGQRAFTRDGHGSWRGSGDEVKLLVSPASARIAALPLSRLHDYVAAANADVSSLVFDVDYVGKLQVTANVPPPDDAVGLKLDGTGAVPRYDVDKVSDVKAAVAEMVDAYGDKVERIGSFNGFVHIDADVVGSRAAVRVVRYPLLAPQANIVKESLFSAKRLFDPSGFDPAMALHHKATIAKDAHVEGKVWDWEYRRPPKGGRPLVSYGIGPHGPSTRVWLGRNGEIVAVVTGECPKNSGWCPS